jgi:glycosyltransferase involved in cell wall biosynthesis
MHLMIFDPHDRGHYLTYVRQLLPGAACADRVTLVLQQGATQSREYQEQLLSLPGNIDVVTSIRPDSFYDGGRLVQDFSSACARLEPDHVWVPSGDVLVKASATARLSRRWRFRSGVEGECGLVELRFHYRPRRWRGHLRHWLNRGLLRLAPWNRFHTIDPTLFTWVQAHDRPLAKRLRLVPDPIDAFAPVTKVAARSALGIPVDGRYVGSVGSHAIPRKGSDLLVQAFANARLASTDRLFLGGYLGERLKHRIESEFGPLYKSGRIVVLDRYLDEDELMKALAAMDVVCTPYIDHLGSSGVVLRAAQAGRPVLAPHQGWFAEMIPRFGLGETGSILEVQALASALERTIEKSQHFQRSAACDRLLEYSHADNFARLWAVRLRERMGLPLDGKVRTWEWAAQGTKPGTR